MYEERDVPHPVEALIAVLRALAPAEAVRGSSATPAGEAAQDDLAGSVESLVWETRLAALEGFFAAAAAGEAGAVHAVRAAALGRALDAAGGIGRAI